MMITRVKFDSNSNKLRHHHVRLFEKLVTTQIFTCKRNLNYTRR